MKKNGNMRRHGTREEKNTKLRSQKEGNKVLFARRDQA